MASATPDLQLPSQLWSIIAPPLIPNYTAWWQRQVCVSGLPRAILNSAMGETWTRDLSITSPTFCQSNTLTPGYQATVPGIGGLISPATTSWGLQYSQCSTREIHFEESVENLISIPSYNVRSTWMPVFLAFLCPLAPGNLLSKTVA